MADLEAYVDYVNQHISKVKEAWRKMKYLDEFPYRYDETFRALVDCLIENHDSSKFSDEELEPYSTMFYPDKDDQDNLEEFLEALDHHYKSNPHHWQWWLTDRGFRYAPPYTRHMYLCEMVCDWMAVGEVKNNSATEYYISNKQGILLDLSSRLFVEKLLSVVEPEQWP